MDLLNIFILFSFCIYVVLLVIIILRPSFIGRTIRYFLKRTIVKFIIIGLSSYILILLILYSYFFDYIQNFDGLFQIVGETFGVFGGLFLAFYYDRSHESVIALEKFIIAFKILKDELDYDIKIIERSFKGRQDYDSNFELLKTTSWEIYKDALNSAPIEWIRNITDIYYYINLLNNMAVKGGILTQQYSHLKKISEIIIDKNLFWQNDIPEEIEKKLINEIMK